MSKYSRPSGAGGFGDLFTDDLNPGLYPGTFKSFEDCEIPVFQGEGEMEPGIAYTFEIQFDDEPPTSVIHKCRAVISTGGAGAPSKIYKLLSGMYGDAPPQSLLSNDAAVDAFFTSCVDKEFSLMIGRKTGKDGKNRPQLLSVSKPQPKGKVKQSVVITKEEQAKLDDQIPF